MRTYFLLAACAAFSVILIGCADQSRTARTVSPKTAASQMSVANPNAVPPASGAPVGQNTAVPRLEMALPPAAPSLPALAPGKIRAAILLPLSGKNAGLGQAMLNAAQQAVFDAAGTNFELQPRDTAGEGGAAEAARAAVADGAQLIIGPLFASDVPPVKAVAQSAGLQMLPLSTDTSLSEHGVYVMGLAPGAQVERVVAYAAAHGSHNFAALVPATPYGALVGQIFATAVARAGGAVVDMQTYDPAAQNEGDRAREIAVRRAGFDALFLPESGSDLKEICDTLVAAGFDAAHAHILGTGLWDVPDLGRQSVLLPGAWYAAPDPAMRRAFIVSYKAAYGDDPPRLATLAYDATALAALLAKQNTRYDDVALTNPNGFAGLDGIFRLTANGTVERGLAVDEVMADGAKMIDRAPSSFMVKPY